MSNRVGRLFAAAMVVCLGGAPLIAADTSKGVLTVVCFGDSTTAARGELKIYSEILREELPRRGQAVQVINAGVGGNHSQLARARFETDVLAHHPDVVVIQFGINDAAVDVWKVPPASEPRVALSTYERNLRHFVQVLKMSEVKVVLMTPNPLRWTPKLLQMYGKPPYEPREPHGFNTQLKAYAEAVRVIARSEHVPLVDVYERFERYGEVEAQSVADLLLDGMHPNARGHRLIADGLLAELAESSETASGGGASDGGTGGDSLDADGQRKNGAARPSAGQ